jgi:hypothetical protein
MGSSRLAGGRKRTRMEGVRLVGTVLVMREGLEDEIGRPGCAGAVGFDGRISATLGFCQIDLFRTSDFRVQGSLRRQVPCAQVQVINGMLQGNPSLETARPGRPSFLPYACFKLLYDRVSQD